VELVDSLQYWIPVAAALALGAALGSLVTLRVARGRFAEELMKVTEELSNRHANTAAELRSARARAQNEIELARLSFKRQLASAGDGPRAAVADTEQRLLAAQAELERLRREAEPPPKAKPSRPSSRPDFEATEIMVKPNSSSRSKSSGSRSSFTSSPSFTPKTPASGFAATQVMEEDK
jgi:hypothetical protein